MPSSLTSHVISIGAGVAVGVAVTPAVAVRLCVAVSVTVTVGVAPTVEEMVGEWVAMSALPGVCEGRGLLSGRPGGMGCSSVGAAVGVAAGTLSAVGDGVVVVCTLIGCWAVVCAAGVMS